MPNGNWNVIYEASGEAYGRVILTIAVIIVLLVYLAFIYKYRKKIDHKLKCFFIAFAAILLLRIVIPILGADNSNKGTMYEQYLAGDCLIVEGYIEGYETDDEWGHPDTFYVNGVEFYVADVPRDVYGYRIRQINGGVLKNGEYVRIHYIEYNMYSNVMMKLELKTTEAP